jgi:hypothetical protein
MRDAPDAYSIVKALGGRWRGRSGMARCPAHKEKTPSLSVTASTTGFVLVHCFGGCPQEAVLAALRHRGLWPEGTGDAPIYAPQPARGSVDRGELDRRRAAEDIWHRAAPVRGTLGETYLRRRGITVPLPAEFRFLASLAHGPSKTSWPCLIAAVRDVHDGLGAMQRTWLARDGGGKAPVKPAKMTLGPMGDGVVKLGRPLATLGLAEGVETALSARQIYSLPVWAVLGGARFATVSVPDDVETVVIFADRGDAGWKYALAGVERFERDGRHAEIVLPDEPHQDFNDVLRARVMA